MGADMHTVSSCTRPKDVLRLLQLGERDFWELAHHIWHDMEKSVPTWRSTLENTHIHVWIAKVHDKELQLLLTLLGKFEKEISGFTIEVHDIAHVGADTFSHTVGALPPSAMHVACGFTEIFLDVLSSAAQGPCLTGIATVGSPYAALGELAFIQHTAQEFQISLDTIRVCWLGNVNGLGQSLMESAIYAPFELFMGIPPEGDPDHYNTGLALKAGAKIFLTREPELALDGAHIIYIDDALTLAAQHESTMPLGLASYDWGQGFTLSPVFKKRATEAVLTVPIHPLVSETMNEGTGLADTEENSRTLKRLQWREAALLALLSRMACARQS